MPDMMTISKRSGQSPSLAYYGPSLLNGRAGTEEADDLEYNVTLAFVVEDRLHNDSLPRYDIDCIDDEPCQQIPQNSPSLGLGGVIVV